MNWQDQQHFRLRPPARLRCIIMEYGGIPRFFGCENWLYAHTNYLSDVMMINQRLKLHFQDIKTHSEHAELQRI